jgi:hypothetical protein
MRKIKFRMFDGAKICGVGELTFFANNAGYHINGEFPATGKNPYPLMQFTKGKEIYKGDVVSIPNVRYKPDNGQSPLSLVAVRFVEGWFVCKAQPLDIDGPLSDWEASDREVIGNIYENPELLNN